MSDSLRQFNLGLIADLQEKLLAVTAENERLQAHAKSMIDAMRADNERLEQLYNVARDQCAMLYAEIERLLGVCKDKTVLLQDAYAQNEQLRAREAQAKTIILAAGVYVPHDGGWQAVWHRDTDKWLGDEQSARERE